MRKPNVRIIVPLRADGGRRDQIWAYCRRQLELLGWPIFVGDHEGDPFSCGTARNRAAVGEWDVAFILDADIVLAHPRQALEAVQEATRGKGYVVCHNHLAMLDEESTNRVLAGQWPQRQSEMEAHENWTTGFAITRELWEEAGGYDERFIGNGGQDVAFFAAAGGLGGRLRGRGRVYHLWHPYASRDHPHWYPNCALAKRYTDAVSDPAKLRAIIAER